MKLITRIKLNALKALQGLLIAFMVFMMIFTMITSKNMNKKSGNFLGYKFFTVLSDSMKPKFQAGDMIITKVVNDPTNLKVGDIITFYSIDPASFGEIITHQIQEETRYESKDAFITKGINVSKNDSYPALAENIISQYSYNVPKAGYFFNFLKTPVGYVTLILCPFLILLIYNGYRFVVVYKEYKKQQTIEIEQQKKLLAEEKEKNEKMIEELKRLKEQLGQNLNNNGELS